MALRLAQVGYSPLLVLAVFSLFQLAIESNVVIGLRIAKFLRGDSDAFYESRLMISEKGLTSGACR